MENDRKKVIEEIGKWKLKQEYVINQKKMGEEYKSISRWLKILTHKDIEKWRKSVGEQVADYITEQSKNRGTIVHEMIKRYLDLSIEDRRKHFDSSHGSFGSMPSDYRSRHCLYDALFMNMVINLENISDVFMCEDWLYSDKYKLLGKVDCIAKLHDYIAIIDFKTKRTHRSKMSVEECIQLSAYACMFNDMFKTDISNIVVMGVSEDGGVWTYRRETKHYIPLLEDLIGYEK